MQNVIYTFFSTSHFFLQFLRGGGGGEIPFSGPLNVLVSPQSQEYKHTSYLNTVISISFAKSIRIKTKCLENLTCGFCFHFLPTLSFLFPRPSASAARAPWDHPSLLIMTLVLLSRCHPFVSTLAITDGSFLDLQNTSFLIYRRCHYLHCFKFLLSFVPSLFLLISSVPWREGCCVLVPLFLWTHPSSSHPLFSVPTSLKAAQAHLSMYLMHPCTAWGQHVNTKSTHRSTYIYTENVTYLRLCPGSWMFCSKHVRKLPVLMELSF